MNLRLFKAFYHVLRQRSPKGEKHRKAAGLESETCATSFDGNNHLTAIGTKQVVYDAAGNVWKDYSTVTMTTYTWDPEGHLIGVSGPATASYAYDALGQRIKAVVSGTTYLYVYDPWGKEFAVVNAGTMTSVYTNLWLGARLFAKYDSTNGTVFLHGDNIGSLTTLTGPASAPVQGETFYPWGQRWATAGSLQEEHFAAFHQRDPGTGLDYTLNRMYTSTQGRWLTPDPGGTKVVSLEDPQTWNMYSYVRDTPLASTDPLGLEPGEQPDEKKVQGHEPATHDDNQGPGKDPEKNPAKMKHDEAQNQQTHEKQQQQQSTAPPNSRTDVVLHGREYTPTPQPGTYFLWQMDWYVSACSAQSCSKQSAANENQTISLVESENGGPWKPTGDPSKGVSHDQISPEPKTFNQHWFVDNKQVQLVVGKDSKGNLIRTWEVHVVINKLGDRPVYSPVP